MLKKIICVDAGQVNGSRGRVRAIIKPHLEAEGLEAMVLVQFPSYCGPPPFQNDPQVVPIVASSILGKIQIPLDLAWATTVHKSQGLTLDKVTVHLGDKEYAAGLSFVALSRVRKLSDLRVTSFDFSRISSIKSMKTLQERIKEFKRLKDLASRADR